MREEVELNEIGRGRESLVEYPYDTSPGHNNDTSLHRSYKGTQKEMAIPVLRPPPSWSPSPPFPSKGGFPRKPQLPRNPHQRIHSECPYSAFCSCPECQIRHQKYCRRVRYSCQCDEYSPKKERKRKAKLSPLIPSKAQDIRYTLQHSLPEPRGAGGKEQFKRNQREFGTQGYSFCQRRRLSDILSASVNGSDNLSRSQNFTHSHELRNRERIPSCLASSSQRGSEPTEIRRSPMNRNHPEEIVAQVHKEDVQSCINYEQTNRNHIIHEVEPYSYLNEDGLCVTHPARPKSRPWHLYEKCHYEKPRNKQTYHSRPLPSFAETPASTSHSLMLPSSNKTAHTYWRSSDKEPSGEDDEETTAASMSWDHLTPDPSPAQETAGRVFPFSNEGGAHAQEASKGMVDEASYTRHSYLDPKANIQSHPLQEQ